MHMDLLSNLYIALPAFNIEQILHMSKLVFDDVVLVLIVMFLLSCSAKGLTIVMLRRKEEA